MKRLLCCVLVMALLCAAVTAQTVSAAETNTALLSHIAGDVNGDWSVTPADVRTVLMAIISETALPAAADANGDGVVDTSDASYALKTAVGNKDNTLVKPTATFIENAPEGEEIAFERVEEHFEYSGHEDTVWIAQSLDELKATYAYSDGKQEKDYSVDFTEDFFEDNAVIIWTAHIIENGLVDVQVTRMVQNGNELCLVRNVEMFLDMPFHWTQRYILVVSKDDLVGVDTIRLCTEYTYREYTP